MKTRFQLLILFAFTAGWMACQPARASYIDLETGEKVHLEKDSTTGQMVNVKTHKPVRLYVDTKTKDTIYGPTGRVINNKLRKNDDGGYVYVDESERRLRRSRAGSNANHTSGEYKIKRDDYKMKVEKDGDIKIKDGDKKIKIDGETGERKVKYDD